MNKMTDRKTAHRHLFDMILTAMLGALTFAFKVAMAAMPNIEPVTLLLILCTLVFSWRAMITCGVYILMEGLFFGFSTWWIPYLYAWPLLIVMTWVFRKRKHPLFWASFAALYGFLFGYFFFPVNYVVYSMAGKPDMIRMYLLNDLPFNLYHAVGNFVIVLVLLVPLRLGMERALKRIVK